eukprot:CAMPEP_0179985854 /NCGR_PEP_ID=MMETSP0984-20121128/1909_1 /TAXON_ID=483367 /ORGANISM="non described non described, Strain CCMP 2436" /LENGTH=153 /DNA_ID=CAMNT_0021904577 /DNA_START=381 /DNA_END=838 /DNA_ORIENTATION=+
MSMHSTGWALCIRVSRSERTGAAISPSASASQAAGSKSRRKVAPPSTTSPPLSATGRCAIAEDEVVQVPARAHERQQLVGDCLVPCEPPVLRRSLLVARRDHHQRDAVVARGRREPLAEGWHEHVPRAQSAVADTERGAVRGAVDAFCDNDGR